jgi:hypothetical protein
LIVGPFARRTPFATAFAPFAFSARTLSAFGALTLAALSAFALGFAVAFARLASFARFAALTLALATKAIAASTAAAEFAFAPTILLLLLLALLKIGIGLIAAFCKGFAILCALGLLPLLIAIHVVVVSLVLRLRRRLRRLHGADEPEIMVSVLEVVLAQDSIARTRGVARKLQVALKDHRRRTADFGLGPVALQRAVGVLMATATTATTAVIAVMSTTARPTAAAPLTLH